MSAPDINPNSGKYNTACAALQACAHLVLSEVRDPRGAHQQQGERLPHGKPPTPISSPAPLTSCCCRPFEWHGMLPAHSISTRAKVAAMAARCGSLRRPATRPMRGCPSSGTCCTRCKSATRAYHPLICGLLRVLQLLHLLEDQKYHIATAVRMLPMNHIVLQMV